MRARARFLAGLAAVAVCAGCGRAAAVRNEQIAGCREDVVRMKAELERVDAELKAKDAVIRELKAKLRNFGVF